MLNTRTIYFYGYLLSNYKPVNQVDKLYEIQAGDHAAFMALYDQWDERVFAYYLQKTRSSDTAKELTQTVFMKIWQYRSSLSADYSFETQLFHRARQVLIDHLRRQASERAMRRSYADHLSRQPGHKDERLEFESDHILQSALRTLPPMRKKVFELHRLQGYSYKEIAAHLSISVKTVDNHLSKAVRQLKGLLALLPFLKIFF